MSKMFVSILALTHGYDTDFLPFVHSTRPILACCYLILKAVSSLHSSSEFGKGSANDIHVLYLAGIFARSPVVFATRFVFPDNDARKSLGVFLTLQMNLQAREILL